MNIFLPKLKEYGFLNAIHMTICIVGSRKMYATDNYGSGEWSIFAPNLTIYGFDADADACEAANAALEEQGIRWTEKHIPLAIAGVEGESTLYVTKGVHCTSLYPPNEAYTKRFWGMNNAFELDFAVEVETTTLDRFLQAEGVAEVDFLQVDVQGADLDVLRGAANILEQSVLAIQAEVEFAPLYVNQPLFADIDGYLRGYEFSLFDLLTQDSWCRRPRTRSPICAVNRSGQLLWADALYLRDPLQESASSMVRSPEKMLKIACLADVFGFPDYTLELLEHLTLEYGDEPQYNFAKAIVDTLANLPDLAEKGIDSLEVVESIRHRL